jgi:RNA-directed DNA polymerase
MATNLQVIRKRVKAMEGLTTIADLCRLTQTDELQLWAYAQKPKYQVFTIPKKVGHRLIEDPEDGLKHIQGVLNDHMQAVYYYQRPACVYGFCISSQHEEEKNIITNARRHLACKYMLNIDLKDFFHQVKTVRIRSIVSKYIHGQDKLLIDTIARLCAYKGRLPMGAPTSPVLSNFAMIELDHELTHICKMYDLTYTRYADDLSFSSQDKPITMEVKSLICDAIAYQLYEINPLKVKWYGPHDVKLVTGLVVGASEIMLQTTYLPQLQKEINIYCHVIQAEARYRTGMSHKKLNLFKQEITGKINFALMVDANDETLIGLIDVFNKAEDIEDLSFSWLDVPYLF